MIDRYSCYAELAQREIHGQDYRVNIAERPSPVLVIAPHGGGIEIGTSELAAAIAGEDHSLFVFEGLKPYGSNRDLHITSHRFDHPDCLRLAERCSVAIGVHGCRGESQVYLGGLDTALMTSLSQALRAAGFDAVTHGHRYPGINPLNICNRTRRKQGVQLELTRDLRDASTRAVMAPILRMTIADHIDRLGILDSIAARADTVAE